MVSIFRHGINNDNIGPIAKASFEEVMNILTNSAVFAEKDNMNGVSSNIFAWQFCKSGTNSFEIMVDEDKLYEEVNDTNYLYNRWNKQQYRNVTDYNIWITSGNGNYASVWNSGLNHYRQEYPTKKYLNF